jgi:alkylhydroperoxidase family enzyme
MHSKDLRAAGETEQRLYTINTWRETPFFTDRERAAFAWAEAVTKLKDAEVPDDIFEEARAHFSEEELVDLTMSVITINSWNRINIAFRPAVGTYTPGAHAVRA